MSVLLTIVIPTYNRAHLIERTIRSILTQTVQDYEVIVVDDGSTDNTQEVVAPYLSEHFRYIKIPNSERGAARNFGTQHANGTYINWFDSDDEMLPHHVATVKELVEQHDRPEVITVHYHIKDTVSGALTVIPHEYDHLKKKRKHYLIEGNYLACNPVIVRKDIALKNAFIEDRDLSASEDYELWLRLLAQYPFVQSSEVTSYLIQHDERSVNTMSDPIKLEKRFLTFLKQTTENPQLKAYLGDDLHYFVMRNYLVLAVDLAYHKHKKQAFQYLKSAFREHKGSVKQRVFWGTVKHLMLP